MPGSTDYTPLKSLLIDGKRAKQHSGQVVYSKVAGRPTLHHAESWSPDSPYLQTRYSTVKRGVARKGSTCSDYTAYGLSRGVYDDGGVYTPLSTHSDYGTLVSSVDTGCLTRSKLARTCGCSKYTVCEVCRYTTTTPRESVDSTSVYDTIRRDYQPKYRSNRDRLRQEVNNNPPLATKQLKYARSMDFITHDLGGSPGYEHSVPASQSNIQLIRSYLDQTTRNNYLSVGRDVNGKQVYSSRVHLNGAGEGGGVFTPSNPQHGTHGPTLLAYPTTLHSHAQTSAVSSDIETEYLPPPAPVTLSAAPPLKPPPPPTSKRKDWNKLRNLLSAVSAVKGLRGRDNRPGSDRAVVRCVGEVRVVALPHLVLSNSPCKCSEGLRLKCPGSFGRKVQSARSCESLLVAGGRIPSIDLGEGHIQVTPLHRSMLGEKHCIQLTSSAGSSTYYSCRNSEERSQWLNHLRKTVNPGEEQMRRCDVSLKVWVQEAKCCTNKKKYYCEISLDKALYARTSTKHKGDMLFWGEQFDFDNLPSVKSLTVTLHREADKKKRRDKTTPIGYVSIPISELESRQLYEKWHTLSPSTLVSSKSTIRDSKTELPQIRLKIRYQTVDILPLASYNTLVKYVKANYHPLVDKLEPMLSVRAKEDIASSLVHILQREQLARRFLCDTVISEVPKHDNLNLMLRGNTIATKAIEAYMKLVGNKYLHDTLEDFIRLLLDSEDSCEVDPGRLENNSMLHRNQCNLISYCEMVWGRIINSHSYFPSELRDVFTSFRRQCEHMKKTEVSDNLISACIFLRFLCPAIMSPSLFGLCQELPEERQSRNFTLVAKTLQSLANFTKFGTKEDYMLFMNDFVEREWNQMQNFLKQISSSDHSYPLTQFEGYIDSGKHISLLHSLLDENLETEDKREKLPDLVPILCDISEELNSPSGTTQCGEESRRSVSSQQSSNLTLPKSSRPESDEYVELSQDKTLDYTNYQTGHASRPPAGKQLNVMSAKHVYSSSTGGAGMQPPSTHLHQRPSLTVGQDSSLSQVSSSAPKDPDADVSNRSDTDTMRSTSSSGSRKIVRHRVWDRVLTDNDLVNGDYIDLISYMDETNDINIPSSANQLAATTNLTRSSSSHSLEIEIDVTEVDSKSTDPTLSLSDGVAPSNINLTSLRKAKPASLQPANKDTPLAFVNPAFKHSTSAMVMSPRHKVGAEALGAPEFTPLPNKFNSLNLRGRSKKGGDMKGDIASPQTLNRYHHRDHTQTLGRHHNTEHTHALTATTSLDLPPRKESKHLPADDTLSADSSDALRDEKRYGCAKFPTMELYPETSTRPQPDGSSSTFDKPPSHQMNELQGGGDRPNTPTGSISWAGSQLSLNSQQTGIRNLQRSIDETAKIKQEYEAEVLVLRQQLSEAQTRLSGTESRLAYQAEQTNEVMGEWKARLDESEERLRAQQHEKDEQIKNIIQRLLAIEEDLRQEQQEMRSAISRKEQIIESQERRIRELDCANNKLQQNLNDMKAKLSTKGTEAKHAPTTTADTSPSPNTDSNKTYKTTLYVTDYHKSSFC